MLQPVSRPPLRPVPDELDVAVVGAGAAGIAAARLCRGAGLRVGILEARDRVGGRAVTARLRGHPVDLGAHWLHAGAMNPLVRLGLERGEPLRRSPDEGYLLLDGRFGTRAERRAQGEAFDRADRAFSEAARGPADRPISAVMPPLGRWRRPTAATFALISGRPLGEVSAQDFPSEEFGDNYFVRGGYGAYLARLAAGLPVALGTAVRRIRWDGPGVVLETATGDIRARAAIVTVPLPVIQAGGLRFAPDLPEPVAGAVAGFLPGAYEHVVLNWPRSPLTGADWLTKLVTGRRIAGLMVNMDGAPFHYLELDWEAVRDDRGPARLAAGARDLLRATFGGTARRAEILTVTDWLRDPNALCSWVVAPPGHAGARAALGEAVGERIWLAGEANSSDLWGTVGGAWVEAERAARAVVERLGGAPA